MTKSTCENETRETLVSQNECRRNAAWCERMAFESTSEETRAAWLMMAENWAAMIPYALLREWEETPSPYARARRKANETPAVTGSRSAERSRRKITASPS